MYRGLSVSFASFFSLVYIASASIIPFECSPTMEMAGRTFIGYNGFSANPRPPQASAGGELGAVFYIADAVDLAKFFANGADHSKDTVCLIHADTDAWNAVPKAWVPAAVLAAGGAAVNRFSPGSVVFAPHTTAGLPAGSPANVYQLGIRQDQIARLQLTTDCRHKNTFPNNEHQTLNYPSLNAQWHIQTTFWMAEEWKEFLINLILTPEYEN